MKKIKLTAIALGLGLGLTGQAQAGDCSAMINDLMAWAQTPVFGENSIGVTMTTNANTTKFASYTKASLDYLPPLFLLNGFIPERLSGEGKTYFSDRTWNYIPPNCTGFCGSAEPFSPTATDKVRLTVKKHTTNTSVAVVTVTLLSWGNAQFSFNASCNNGHIYGFHADQHGTHLYDLTFKKEQFLAPR